MTALSETDFKQNYQMYLKHLKLKGLQPKTVAYVRGIRRLGEYFDYQIHELSEAQLLEYFTDLLETHSWNSVKLDLYALKFIQFLNAMRTFFRLHSRLQEDCIELGCFELCRLLLMNDNQYPWFILVPEVENVQEVYQLSRSQRDLLNEESCYLAEQLAKLYHADKMNVAVIGNIVPQLHVHHIVRYCNDRAWPAPVWGRFPAIPYSQEQIELTLALLAGHLAIKSG